MRAVLGLIAAGAAALATGCQVAPAAPPLPVDFVPLPAEVRGGQILNKPLPASWGKVYVGVSCTRPACVVEYDLAAGSARIVAWMRSNAVGGGMNRPGKGLLKEDPPEVKRVRPWPLCQDVIAARLFEHEPGRIVGATSTSAADPDATRHYAGGHWFVLDVRTGELTDLGIPQIGEGIAAMCHQPGARSSYYMVTWPAGKFIFAGLDRGARRAAFAEFCGLATTGLGLVSRYIDAIGDATPYVPDGATGELLMWIKYVPKDGEKVRRFRFSRQLGLDTPAAAEPARPASLEQSSRYGNAWFDGCSTPDQTRLFAATSRSGRLIELDATRGRPTGVLIDHGDVAPWRPGVAHATAVAVGADGKVDCAVEDRLCRLDPASGAKELCGSFVDRASGRPLAGCFAATGPAGRLYFAAHANGTAGIFAFDPGSIRDPRPLAVSPRIEQTPNHAVARKLGPPRAEPELTDQEAAP